MTLWIFGDSWGTPWSIPRNAHFLHRYCTEVSGCKYRNLAKAGTGISQVRNTFFQNISDINPRRDSVFFVIPPDIRLFFPVPGESDIRTISVIEREWHNLLGDVNPDTRDRYFYSVVGSEILLLQNTCLAEGLSYTMWHNYGVIDFSAQPYYNLIDTTRFPSTSSMMSNLLGYEYSLADGDDGPDVRITNSSKYFLYRDQHPSVKGHDRLLEIYTNWAKTRTFV